VVALIEALYISVGSADVVKSIQPHGNRGVNRLPGHQTQSDDSKDERTFANSPARARRAASASSISTFTNLTGVLG